MKMKKGSILKKKISPLLKTNINDVQQKYLNQDSTQLNQKFKKFQQSVSNIYNMSPEQFKKISDFFNNKSKDGQFIRIVLVKELMYTCIKNRNNIKASEKDIDTTLETIKNYEEFLDFEEFVAFLTLFFASKHNFEKRANCFLKSRDFKLNNCLTFKEAYEKASVFFKFYSIIKHGDKLDLIYRLFKFEDDLQFTEFISQIYPFLKTRMFVKW